MYTSYTTRLIKATAPVLIAALGLFIFSCTKKEEAKPPVTAPSPVSPDARVVATINGDPITLGEFQERLARAGLNSDAVGLDVKEEFLNSLISREMMVHEAQRRRIKVSLAEINQRIETFRHEEGKDVKDVLASEGIDFEKWKNDIWEDMMIEKLLALDVNRHISVSPAEIRQYYQANSQKFERPEQVRARQIVVQSESEAKKVLDLLKNHADFATVAREKSTAPEAERGGDLGYFARGEMPADFNVIFGLKRGEISGIVKSPYGFHIFKLEDRRPAGKKGLNEVSKEIEEKLRRDKQDRKFTQWLKELRSRTKFEVNYQALE